MNMKKLFPVLLALLMIFVLAACDQTGSSQAAVSSLTNSALTETSSVNSVISEITMPAPQVSEGTVIADPVSATGTVQTFEVTDALREQFLEYFSRSNSKIVPLGSFSDANALSSNELAYFGVGVTQPLQTAGSGDAVMSLYDIFAVQANLQKYLGVQIQDLASLSIYGYNASTGILQVDVISPFSYNLYRLTALSQDADGVYTGVFEVYQILAAQTDDFDADRAAYITALEAASVPNGYAAYASAVITFGEFTDENGQAFYRFYSKTQTIFE